MQHRTAPSLPTRRSSDLGRVRLRRADLQGVFDAAHTAGRVTGHPSPVTQTKKPHALACGCSGSISTAGSTAEGLAGRSEEHTSELQSQSNIVCRLLLDKK